MKDYFQTLARYNEWANRRLYDAVTKLPDAERTKKRPSFFGSIFATLNHILVADRIWCARIQGKPHGIKALDEKLYDDFDALHGAREEFDSDIIRLVDGLGEKRIMGLLAFKNMAGEAQEWPVHYVLGHFFNHQTHHRGQVHDQLSQTDIAPPPLDFFYYLKERDGK